MAKTLVATGTSGGLGFEVIKQLLTEQPSPFRFILGVRNPGTVTPKLDAIDYDRKKHQVTLHQCDFADLSQVKRFAKEALADLGEAKLDYLMLNHAIAKASSSPGPNGSKWSESYIVNHLSHHYLTHLLRPAIERSHTRVVFVSSGAVRNVKETETLHEKFLAASGADVMQNYPITKFAQLLGAHWWRRALGNHAEVVAVSPGMIPTTDIFRYSNRPNTGHPDAKDIPTGARSILAAFHRTDLPADPNAIFLTSWGEWWDPNEQYPLSLDATLQDRFCPSQETVEKEEHV